MKLFLVVLTLPGNVMIKKKQYTYSCQKVFHVLMRTGNPSNAKRSGDVYNVKTSYCLPIIQRNDRSNIKA